MPIYSRSKSRSRSPPSRDRIRDDNRRSERRKETRPTRYRSRSRSPQQDEPSYRRCRKDPASRSDEEASSRRKSRGTPPLNLKHRDRSRSRSPSGSGSRQAFQRSRGPLPSQDKAFNGERVSDAPAIEKEKPNYAPTGRLAAAANTVQTAGQTIIMKYHEPVEARKPPAKEAWRMYVFKNGDIVDTIPLSEQSCWLFGRELAVADIPIEHLSCSKQHAVVQFRYIEKKNEFGDKIGKVKPFVLDLESSHGTLVNGEKIPEAKYFEVRDKDVIKFGSSKREYIVQLPSG